MMQMTFFLALWAFAGCVMALPNLPQGISLYNRALYARADCNQATYESLMFSKSMGAFLEKKNAGDPSCFDWSDDGCSCSPDQLGDFDFLNACKRHDFGYRTGKALGILDEPMRARVDDKFGADLYDVCSGFTGWDSLKGILCRQVADLYVETVRTFGKKKREVGLQKRECDIIEAVGNLFD